VRPPPQDLLSSAVAGRCVAWCEGDATLAGAYLDAHVWAGGRDERLTASLDTLLSGIQAARRPHRRSGRKPGR